LDGTNLAAVAFHATGKRDHFGLRRSNPVHTPADQHTDAIVIPKNSGASLRRTGQGNDEKQGHGTSNGASNGSAANYNTA
jgi:hypothetical protein